MVTMDQGAVSQTTGKQRRQDSMHHDSIVLMDGMRTEIVIWDISYKTIDSSSNNLNKSNVVASPPPNGDRRQTAKPTAFADFQDSVM